MKRVNMILVFVSIYSMVAEGSTYFVDNSRSKNFEKNLGSEENPFYSLDQGLAYIYAKENAELETSFLFIAELNTERTYLLNSSITIKGNFTLRPKNEQKQMVIFFFDDDCIIKVDNSSWLKICNITLRKKQSSKYFIQGLKQTTILFEGVFIENMEILSGGLINIEGDSTISIINSKFQKLTLGSDYESPKLINARNSFIDLQKSEFSFIQLKTPSSNLILSYQSKTSIKNSDFGNIFHSSFSQGQQSLFETDSQIFFSFVKFIEIKFYQGSLLVSKDENGYVKSSVENCVVAFCESGKASLFSFHTTNVLLFNFSISHNNFIDSTIISLSNQKQTVSIEGLSFINNSFSTAMNVLLLKEISIKNMFCSSNNLIFSLNSSSNKGPCLKLLDVEIAKINNFVLHNSVGTSDIPGIAAQRSLIKASYFYLLNSYFKQNKYMSSSSMPGTFGLATSLIQLTEAYFYNFSSINNIVESNTINTGLVCYFKSEKGRLYVETLYSIGNRIWKGVFRVDFMGEALFILNTYFERNSQINNSYLETSTFGGIRSYSHYLFIENYTNFMSLSERSVIVHSELFPFSVLIIKGLKSLWNTAKQAAGALLLLGSVYNRQISFFSCIFIRNWALQFGGSGVHTKITTFILKHNILFLNTTFDGNCGDTSTTTYWVSDTKFKLILIDCVLKNNENRKPTGLGIIGLSSLVKFLTFHLNVLYLNNTSIYNGIRLENVDFVAIDCTYKDSFAGVKGPQWAVMRGGFAKIINCMVMNGYSVMGAFIDLDERCVGIIINTIVEGVRGESSIVRAKSLAYFFMHNVKFIDCKLIEPRSSFFQIINSPRDIFSQLFNISIINSNNLLFDMTECRLILKNVTVNNNYGGFIYGSNSKVIISGLKIFNQSCKEDAMTFCFMNSRSNELSIENAVIDRTKDFSAKNRPWIKLEASNFTLSNCDLKHFEAANINSILIKGSTSMMSLQQLNYSDGYQGFMKFTDSVVTIVLSSFTVKNTKSENSLIVLLACREIVISQSKFLASNFSLIGTNIVDAGLLLINGAPKVADYFLISDNLFSGSAAKGKGGACYIKNSKLNMQGNIFIKARSSVGGAVVLECSLENLKSCDYRLENNFFNNNTASEKGGAVQWEFKFPKGLFNNQYLGNQASFGNDFASFPSRFEAIIDPNIKSKRSQKSNVLYIEHSSGARLNGSINLVVKDTHDQKVTRIPSKTFAKIEILDKRDDVLNSNNTQMWKNLSDFIKEKNAIEDDSFYQYHSPYLFGKASELIDELSDSFIFDNVFITATPTSYVYLKFSSIFLTPNVEAFNYSLGANNTHVLNEPNSSYFLVIPVFIEKCSFLGNAYSVSENLCEKCPFGKYNIAENQTKCKECPPNAVCDENNNLILNKGYWRSSLYSDNIYKCNQAAESCLGGIDSACAPDYEGIVCKECKPFEDKIYQTSLSGECRECPHVGLMVVVYLLLYLSISFVLKKLTDLYISVNKIKKIILKSVINYYHMLLFYNTFSVSLPGYFSKTIQSLKIVSSISTAWYSMECIVKYFDKNFTVYSNLITASTFFYLMIGFIYAYLHRLRKKGILTSGILREKIIIIVYLLGPPYLSFLYENSACAKFDLESRLMETPSTVCWTPKYNAWFALFIVPSWILWGLVIPFYIHKYSKISSSSISNYEDRINNKNTENRLFQRRNSPIPIEFKIQTGQPPTTVEKNEKVNFSIINIGYKTTAHVWEYFNYLVKIGIIILYKNDIADEIRLLLIFPILFYWQYIEREEAPYDNKLSQILSLLIKLVLLTLSYNLMWAQDSFNISSIGYAFLYLIILLIHLSFFFVCIIIWKKEYFRNSFALSKFLIRFMSKSSTTDGKEKFK